MQHLRTPAACSSPSKWHGDDVAESSALAKDMDSPADEQLVEVLLAPASRLENRRVIEEAEEFIEVGFEFFLRKHVIRRIPHHAVEPRRAVLHPVLVPDLPLVGVDEVEEHFGEFDLPVEEAAIRSLGQGLDLGDQASLLVVLQRGVEALRDRSGPGGCRTATRSAAWGRPKCWATRKSRTIWYPARNWRAWSYRLTDVATSAAVASAILLTNRTWWMARNSGS